MKSWQGLLFATILGLGVLSHCSKDAPISIEISVPSLNHKGDVVLDLKLRNLSQNRALIFNFDSQALRSWRCSLDRNFLKIDIRLRGLRIFDADDEFNIAVYHDILRPAEQKIYQLIINHRNCSISQREDLKARRVRLDYAYLLLKPAEEEPKFVGTNMFFGDRTFLEKQATGKINAAFP